MTLPEISLDGYGVVGIRVATWMALCLSVGVGVAILLEVGA